MVTVTVGFVVGDLFVFVFCVAVIVVRSKNSKPLCELEAEWLELVKQGPCAVCNVSGPVEAHHTQQGNHFTTIALCPDCHRGPMGWHGDKTLWKIYKVNENEALNITIMGVFAKWQCTK